MQKMDKLKFYEELISTNYIESTCETQVKFSYKRIQQKYKQLEFRYRDRMRSEEIFGFCIDILYDMNESDFKNKKYIHIAENKTMKNGKFGYHDDITKIIFRLDKRINDKIDMYLGTYEKMEDGQRIKYSPLFCESLEDDLYTSDEQQDDDPDAPKKIGDAITNQNNIFYDEMSEFTYEEIEMRLHNIYKKAKLNDREIEVLQALEMTPNNDKGEIYTRKVAGELLNCTGQNISNIFNRAKKKIKKTYQMETRHDKVIEIDDFLDSIEDEKDIIDFILDNIEKEYINYILYDSDLDSKLVKYFNKNNEIKAEYNTYRMRKFCTYFLKELYTYKELIEFNIKMQETPKIEVAKVKKKESNFIDNKVYTYIAESKLKNHEKKGKYILVDGERYYYKSSYSDKKNVEEVKENNKIKYEKMTFLKR